jgi:hypothetical protein
MANSANGNVLPLGNHPRARSRLTSQESTELLAGCREMALSRMTVALATMLDRVEDDLFEMAEASAERETRDAFLEARSHARAGRAGIESTFRRHFLDIFNRKLKGETAVAQPAEPAALSLVDDEELEESIAVSEMSRKLQAACDGELFALSARMGFLLERPELADDANPMSPATICAALRDACDQIQAGFRVRMTLLRQFERHAETELQRIYRDLNAHLVQQRILPEVKPEARRSAGAAPRPLRPETPKAPAAPDAFATLAQLLGAALPAGAAPAAVPGGSVAGSAPLPSAASQAAALTFVGELTRLHRETYAAMEPAGRAVNVVREMKARPEAQALGELDAMTMDLVSMLFDYVFEDDAIPAAVKALLGRLQIPLLKAALLDKAFFSSKSHPARRLLDGLADCAFGLDEDDTRGVETLAMIDGVVDRVLDQFESDVSLFETLAAEVAGFLEARERVEDDIVQRSAHLVEARERREIAEAVAQSEVSRRLEARAWVPPAVRDMLLDAWARALAAVFLVEGEGSAPWQRLVLAMEDLLWSVEPKAAPEDRKRLLAMLPSMLREIQAGMQRAGMSEAERDAFMGSLVDSHATAVKAGLRGLAAMPAPMPLAPPETPAIERELIEAGDMQVEEIRLKAPRGAATRNVFTRTGIYTNVQRGSWVEFLRPGGAPIRARLTWVSPNKGVYLFTNPITSTAAVSISPEALAEQMRLGEARLVDAAPLTERAVDSMLATLRDRTAGARSPSP